MILSARTEFIESAGLAGSPAETDVASASAALPAGCCSRNQTGMFSFPRTTVS